MSAEQCAPILEKIRAACLKRGASGIKGFGRMFRIYDDDGSKSLNGEEMMEGLTDYKVSVTPEELKTLIDYLDKDGNGSINFDEFLMMVRPPMSDSRIKVVKAAFKKADKSGDGVLTPQDLKGVYKAREHPKYKNGEWDEKKVFEEFLKNFEPDERYRDAKVTEKEFLNYYAGVSASIDNDCYFDLMMRNAWKI